MKPSFTVTLSRLPENCAEGDASRALTDIANQVFQLRIGIQTKIAELKDADQIIREVSDTTRMVAFIRFHDNHLSLEITFSKAKEVCRELMFSYYFSQRKVVFVGQLINGR